MNTLDKDLWSESPGRESLDGGRFLLCFSQIGVVWCTPKC